MTKEEFYSNIREYKASKSLKHGNDPEVWERDSFDFAVAALTKSKLAKYAGETADASRFEIEYNGYMNKLAHMDERAAKALEQKVLASAEAKYRECLTKLIAAKHSDEPLPNEDYLEHHGIKGQKWGVRRYQNEDGTLTDAGKARLKGYYDKGKDKKAERTFEKWTKNNLTDDESKQILKKSTIGQLLAGPIANAIGGTRELSKIRSSEAYNARLSKAIKLLNSSDYGKKLKSMVTKKSSQPKQDSSSNNSNSKEGKLERAKKEDKFDMDFLEATQNKDWFDDHDKMVSEYSKYLDDPKKYWNNRNNKR